MHKLWELAKDLIIAALVCSLLLLALVALPAETIRSHQWLSQLLQPVSPLLGLSQAELTYVQTELPSFDASQPTAISVNHAGGRSTAMWSFEALDAAFETYGGFLGQAMDTAGDFTPIEETELLRLLRAPSVSFHYESSLPASLLAYWLDASLDEDAPDARVCVLAPEDETVALVLTDGAQACRAETQVAADGLLALLRQPAPDGSAYAFELGLDLDPLSLIPGAMPELTTAYVTNPLTGAYIDALATDLGFNPYNETRYQDESGTTFFSELNASLTVSAGGLLHLSCTPQERFTAASDRPEAKAELARQLVQDAAVTGPARLYLSGLSTQEDQTVLTFDYYYDAVPLAMYPGHAATVTFTERSITDLLLQLARFTPEEQPLYPLPIPQAAALLPDGAPLKLQFCITPEQLLSAGWKGA